MYVTSTYSLLPLVSSLFVITLGFFVWLKRTREQLHVLFFLYSFTIALWLFGTFILLNSTSEAGQIRADRFIYAPVVFIPIFLYHFGLLYCKFQGRQKILLIIGYLLAFVFLPLSQSDYFVTGLYHYKWGVHTIAQTGHHFFLAYFGFYFLLFFLNLLRYRRKVTGVQRKQITYLVLGFAVLDLIGPLAFLPAYGIPVYPIIFLSGVPFAIIVAYAIIRLNALDLRTITSEVIVTILNFVILIDLLFSTTLVELAARSIVFLIVFIFSIILVRSVKKEINRRKELTKLAKSLEQANLRLQELDRQKTEFLSIASHQLRTPLSILKGYLELIGDGAYGKVTKKMKGVLTDMDDSNNRLIKLSDEFLDIARIEQGRTKFAFEMYDMNKLVTSVVDELKGRAKDRKLKLVWKKLNTPAIIYMDDEKIRHVIFNFIDNAIKYTQKGSITVALMKNTDGSMAVTVTDTGIGFGKEDEANFFQKFYRGKNVDGTNVNGTGLGIYVCRKFIEAHEGRVWAKSAGKGKGSEFGFSIPSRTPQAEEKTMLHTKADVV